MVERRYGILSKEKVAEVPEVILRQTAFMLEELCYSSNEILVEANRVLGAKTDDELIFNSPGIARVAGISDLRVVAGYRSITKHSIEAADSEAVSENKIRYYAAAVWIAMECYEHKLIGSESRLDSFMGFRLSFISKLGEADASRVGSHSEKPLLVGVAVSMEQRQIGSRLPPDMQGLVLNTAQYPVTVPIEVKVNLSLNRWRIWKIRVTVCNDRYTYEVEGASSEWLTVPRHDHKVKFEHTFGISPTFMHADTYKVTVFVQYGEKAPMRLSGGENLYLLTPGFERAPFWFPEMEGPMAPARSRLIDELHGRDAIVLLAMKGIGYRIPDKKDGSVGSVPARIPDSSTRRGKYG
jgi:hypothetical protein